MTALDRLAIFLQENKMGALKEDKPVNLDTLIRQSVRFETHRDESKQELDQLEQALSIITKKRDDAQRNLNFWQSQLDETEKQINNNRRETDHEST